MRRKQHRYLSNGKCMFIWLKGLTVIAEVREGKKIIERRERVFTEEQHAERMYKAACKTLFPAFQKGTLVLANEQLEKNSRE